MLRAPERQFRFVFECLITCSCLPRILMFKSMRMTTTTTTGLFLFSKVVGGVLQVRSSSNQWPSNESSAPPFGVSAGVSHTLKRRGAKDRDAYGELGENKHRLSRLSDARGMPGLNIDGRQ